MSWAGDRAALAAFLGSTLLAGNAVGIRFSNRELSPLWGAGLAAGGLLIVAGVYVGALRPLRAERAGNAEAAANTAACSEPLGPSPRSPV